MEAAHPFTTPTNVGETLSVKESGWKAAPSVDDQHLRRCLATGEMLPKERLLRFVIGPDQTVVPDLAQNLPGKGLWVTATREAIELAATKGLFAKAAKTSAKRSKTLADDVAHLLRARCLNHLGLACRAGIVVLSELQVETAVKGGKLGLLLMANDAKHDMTAYPAAPATFNLFTRHELGAAFGYAQSVYVGLLPHTLTRKIKQALEQLQSLSPSTQANG